MLFTVWHTVGSQRVWKSIISSLLSRSVTLQLWKLSTNSFYGRLDHENLCQRGESTGMGYYLHGLPIAVEKFSGEIHFRNTTEQREINRLTEKEKNKQGNKIWKKTTDVELTRQKGDEQGSKSPFSLLSEPISPSSLLFISSSTSIQFNSPYSQHFLFSLLPTFSPYFSLLPTFFGSFLPPPYSVPPPSRQFSMYHRA